LITSIKKVVYKTIQDIVNHTALEFFSEQHQVLNEQTIIQKKENDKARPNGCDQKEVFIGL
jgi:hypothetical protein